MSYGFLAQNKDNQIQISEGTTNYAAIFSGSLLGGSSSYSNYYSTTVTISGYSYQAGDVLAIRHNNSEIRGTWGDMRSNGFRIFTWLSSSATISWKILRRMDQVSLPAPSGYGLEIFKSNGTDYAFSTRAESGVISKIFTNDGLSASLFSWSGVQPWMAANIGCGQTAFLPGEGLEPTESQFACVVSAKNTSTTGSFGIISEIDETGGFPVYVPNVINTSARVRLAIKTGA